MLGALRETTALTTTNIIGLLARHWVVCAVCAVVGAAIATSLAMFVVTPSYSASMRLYVSGTGATADDRWTNGEYARTHVASYAEMIDSQEVLEAVRTKLGLPQSQEGGYLDLADDISATNPLDTLIIEVTVKDSSPERAQAVAAAIGDVYDSVVGGIESPARRQQSPVRITVVSPAALPTKQDSPSRKLYAAAGLLVGAAVGAGVAWLLDRRRARKSAMRAPAGSPQQRWPWWPDNGTDQASQERQNLMWRQAGSSAEVNGSRVGNGRTRKEHDPAAP